MNREHEREQWARGAAYVCGVDEAGRGPLAGPVCAAAVILPRAVEIAGLNDSKQLTERRREALFAQICDKAVAWSVALVDAATIDQINILQATLRAMTHAVERLSVPADYALIDGNCVPPLSIPCHAIVRGDASEQSVAAASVLAKVWRDRVMRQYDAHYPVYGFARHKGYGTAAHEHALLIYGPCGQHRRSFLKKFYQRHPEAPR